METEASRANPQAHEAHERSPGDSSPAPAPSSPTERELSGIERGRRQRLLNILDKCDRALARAALRSPSPKPQTQPIVAIQCWWRRVLARRVYRERLFKLFKEEDRRMVEKQRKVVEETLMLLETIRIQQDRRHRTWIEEDKRRTRQRSAYRIQRWFKRKSSSGGTERRAFLLTVSESGEETVGHVFEAANTYKQPLNRRRPTLDIVDPNGREAEDHESAKYGDDADLFNMISPLHHADEGLFNLLVSPQGLKRHDDGDDLASDVSRDNESLYDVSVFSDQSELDELISHDR